MTPTETVLQAQGLSRCYQGDGVSVLALAEASFQVSPGEFIVVLEPLDLPAQAGAGWQADLTFATVARENVLSVPASAIVPQDGGSAVYLIRGGRAALAPVETGLRTGGRVEILSGLAAGDRIVTDPYGAEVRQGARVSAGN